LKSGKPNEGEFFVGRGEWEDKSQDNDSLLPLVCRPHCNNNSDFEDDDDSVPELMPSQATEMENADNADTFPELCFPEYQHYSFKVDNIVGKQLKKKRMRWR
jgi:hypothetical protein